MADTEWMSVDELAEYSKLSTRQLHRMMAEVFNRLPSYLVAGRRLVRRSEYDAWATGAVKTRRKPGPKPRVLEVSPR